MADPNDDLSVLEQYAMHALVRLHPNGYGVNVREEIERRAGKTVSIGSIYATLDRLASRGMVSSRLGEATAERGGRRKTYFALTGHGQRALNASERAIDAMRGLIAHGVA